MNIAAVKDGKRGLTITRRNLQRDYVGRLSSMLLGSRGSAALAGLPSFMTISGGGGSIPADARALLGAFRKGYTIIKKLDDGFILARQSSQPLDSTALSVIDADFMISFNTPQINKNKESYTSVITQGRFE
jgi:hypothetical protein